uniref:Thioredoxin-like protein 4B n=2 Tax=Populus trichocarpa TaxID=3694 RepID=A0A3N7EHK0_POPTR
MGCDCLLPLCSLDLPRPLPTLPLRLSDTSSLLYLLSPAAVSSLRKMSDYLSTTLLTKKKEIDCVIRDAIDKVLVLRFGRASDPVCLHLDDILQLSKSAREVSKFATIALVDIDSEDVQVYVNYFDITLVPSTVFFFNAHHMKMDSGTADHTKWVGAFHRKQDFIDVVEAIFRAAMKGKLIANCPLPPERIPKYELLYKNL